MTAPIKPDEADVTSAMEHADQCSYRSDFDARVLGDLAAQVAWQEGENERLKTETITLRRHLHRVVRYGATCLPSNTKQWLEEFMERLESADKLLAESKETKSDEIDRINYNLRALAKVATGYRKTISKQQRKINAMRETMDHIHTRLASLNSSVRNKASQIARLNGLLKTINAAIDDSGQVLVSCGACGTMVVSPPCPPIRCEKCAEEMAEPQPATEDAWLQWPPSDGTKGVIARWQDGRRASVLPYRGATGRRKEWMFDRNPAVPVTIILDDEDLPTHYCVLAEPTEKTT